MKYWANLKEAISKVIKENNNQEITGPLLQSVLLNIVSSVGEHATFAGIAKPDTVPAINDGPIFYIAVEAGMYSNFGGLIIKAPSILSTKSSETEAWSASSLSFETLPTIRAFSTPAEHIKGLDVITFDNTAGAFDKVINAGYKVVLFRYAQVRPRYTSAQGDVRRPKRVSKKGYHVVCSGGNEPIVLRVISDYKYLRRVDLVASSLISNYRSYPDAKKIVVHHGGRTRINVQFGQLKKLKFGIGFVKMVNDAKRLEVLQIIPFSVSVFATDDGELKVKRIRI